MKKIILLLIFVLALILRFWQLGLNPSSLDWDETSLGYNAYSLLHTGKDEYGISWPLSIKSFGDYKPPLYTYLTIIPIALLGLNEYSARIISAIFGFLSIIISYFLFKQLFPDKPPKYSLLFAFFFALSPWHIQFSRIAFEANIALFFIITGVWLFLKGLTNGPLWLLSAVSFSLAAYSYHSPRLIVPILLLGMILIYRNNIRKSINWLIIAGILCVVLSVPIIKDLSINAARLNSVTILNPFERLGTSIKQIDYDRQHGDLLGAITHNRRIVYGREIVSGYLDHFNFDFLFISGDPPGRHHAAGMGMLYLWDFPMVIIGIFILLKNRSKSALTVLLWFVLAPIAAALTTGTPHAVRALFYLPIYQLFITFGFVGSIDYLQSRYSLTIFRSITLILAVLYIINIFYYLDLYWIQSPIENAKEWQYGYKQVVDSVAQIEAKYQKVIVTYHYDQPYIFFLFYNKVDPSWYQQNWGGGEIERMNRSFGKYEFRNISWSQDSQLPDTILVGTPDEIPADAMGLQKEIYFPDGSVAFRITAN